jgi:hypothetical protein
MNLDLTDEETAALLKELDRHYRRRPVSIVASHSDLEGDPRENQTGADTRAVGAKTVLRATAPQPRTAPPRLSEALSRTSDDACVAAKAGVRLIVWYKGCQRRLKPDRCGAGSKVWRGNKRSRLATAASVLAVRKPRHRHGCDRHSEMSRSFSGVGSLGACSACSEIQMISAALVSLCEGQ